MVPSPVENVLNSTNIHQINHRKVRYDEIRATIKPKSPRDFSKNIGPMQDAYLRAKGPKILSSKHNYRKLWRCCRYRKLIFRRPILIFVQINCAR